MWVKQIADFQVAPPKKLINWMIKPNNMGDALRKVCRQLTVNILDQNFRDLLPDETFLINSSDNKAYIRSIFLQGDTIPFCYGRVVVPPTIYADYQSDFNNLGTKLIGETLLYNNPKTIRSAFEFGYISNQHPIHAYINQFHAATAPLWARRSIFHLNGLEPILISEVFLADIPDYMS